MIPSGFEKISREKEEMEEEEKEKEVGPRYRGILRIRQCASAHCFLRKRLPPTE